LFAARLDAGARPVSLTDTYPAELAALALPVPEIVEYAHEDGAKVKAFVFKPPHFDPQKKYPLVIFIHGAGYLQEVTKSLTAYEPNYLFHQRLARRGYVVLDPDYRHSQGYGRKFRTDIHGYMGGKDLEDVIAGIDLLRDRGWIDEQRVGIYGGSYGGFLTLMALFTKSDRFAAGCALRSVTDWRTYNAWYTNPRLGDPTRDAENYRRSSPIDHAKGLSKPLLLIHGLKDSNVFAQDTIRLVETLIELRKDEFEMMLYPSQDHGFVDADSWFDEYRRIERFFDRHLRPGAR
jgi:dipeptidyl aminopeptidase/acylaminoacyl peptidase